MNLIMIVSIIFLCSWLHWNYFCRVVQNHFYTFQKNIVWVILYCKL